jgi:hypothetical protein
MMFGRPLAQARCGEDCYDVLADEKPRTDWGADE